MTILTFLFFTALVGVITWILTRKDDHGTSTGYFLAGRTLTGGYIAGSLLLTNLSTEQLVGLNGAAFKDGICVMAWEVIAGASLVIMALYFLPKYLRSGIATIPEFLEKRFDATTRSITTFIFIAAYTLILLPIILYSGATGLMGILDLKTLTGIQNETTLLWLTVWFIGIVGSIYAIFGGLRSVAVSDTLNGFGLLVGSVMITVFALGAVGDGGLLSSLSEIKEAHPEKFNSLGSKDSSVPFSTLFTGVLLLNLFYWTTNQQIIQRTFGATSLAEGQRGVLIAGIFKVMAPLVLVLPGVIAFHLYGTREGFKPDHAYGTLVSEVLPSWLTGFFAAVMVGAILSSFNSALNSTATLFSLGVYKQHFQKGV
ncbi:MAG: solute:sodium symporter family transporter, partial [Verrucomicrobiales bacterium]